MKPFYTRDTKPPGECTTVLRKDGVLFTVFKGRITPDVIQTCSAQIKLNQEPGNFWLVDAGEISYDPAIVAPARVMLGIVRATGRKVLGVVYESNLGVRMIARTICLAADIRLELFADMQKAEAYILDPLNK